MRHILPKDATPLVEAARATLAPLPRHGGRRGRDADGGRAGAIPAAPGLAQVAVYEAAPIASRGSSAHFRAAHRRAQAAGAAVARAAASRARRGRVADVVEGVGVAAREFLFDTPEGRLREDSGALHVAEAGFPVDVWVRGAWAAGSVVDDELVVVG